MRLILALASFLPALALGGPWTETLWIEGKSATMLMGSLSLPENHGIKTFAAAGHPLFVECYREENRCMLGLDREVRIYQHSDARRLYRALNVEEYKGRFGKMKIFVDPSESFEILCSFSPIPAEEPYSCTIKLKK
jgi:hypothetical protein